MVGLFARFFTCVKELLLVLLYGRLWVPQFLGTIGKFLSKSRQRNRSRWSSCSIDYAHSDIHLGMRITLQNASGFSWLECMHLTDPSAKRFTLAIFSSSFCGTFSLTLLFIRYLRWFAYLLLLCAHLTRLPSVFGGWPMRVSGISAQFLRTNTMPARGPACPVAQARFTLVLRFARPGFFNCRTESPAGCYCPRF